MHLFLVITVNFDDLAYLYYEKKRLFCEKALKWMELHCFHFVNENIWWNWLFFHSNKGHELLWELKWSQILSNLKAFLFSLSYNKNVRFYILKKLLLWCQHERSESKVGKRRWGGSNNFVTPTFLFYEEGKKECIEVREISISV